ncbi:LacI family DNA-binding transcriptional regulator [Caproiciproducens sp. MSJ-32]|uniref:LacI family DNA-binding transcriptional regulator n=1 Tax=Caproiciproducens sp. MSJ-32 TaxID=2841527 RepID=UPI001C12163A|nr:LacI family DNA-binding transcriptional regulator [Caproiciproducens sp. MSJ-32]MBU5453849.1 LacI family DNA-binding transcriptional regulator [Caproiciproducens sp. MSJ-32]
MKVTIQDIANMVGVSKSTVSRYLNGGYVSDDNKKKIEEAIEKTGFKSNFFAKRLKAKQSGLIGIIIPRIDSFTSGKILKSINKRLEENGYQGIILTSELSKEKEIEHMKKLYQQGVDGIIILAVNITKEHIELSRKLSIPILFTGQKSSLVNYIKIDDYEAGRVLGQYIRDNGHRNIVYLGVTEEDKAVGVERKAGFYDVFKDIECNINFVKTGFSFNEAYEASREVMKYKPTAVIGATDNIVLGFIRYAYENGYRIPDEISVAGFGGYDIGLAVHPTITTVEINYETLGEKTSDLILSYINGEEIDIDRKVPLKLIKRESVKSLL